MRTIDNSLIRYILGTILVMFAGCAAGADRARQLPIDLPSAADESIDEGAFDRVERYRRTPIRLRSAGVDQLVLLPGFDRTVAERLVIHIDSSRPTSIDELSSLDWLDAWHLAMLRTYTTLDAASSRSPRVDLLTRLGYQMQPPKGVRDTLRRVLLSISASGDTTVGDTIVLGSSWVGGRPELQSQLRAVWGEHELAARIVKPAGAPLWYTDTAEFSYIDREAVVGSTLPLSTSTHFGGVERGYVRFAWEWLEATVGDYTSHVAGGLTLGRDRFGGGPVTRAREEIAGTLSASEAHRLRGAAIRLRPPIDGTELLLLWSHTARDVSIERAEDGSVRSVRVRSEEPRRTRLELRERFPSEELIAARARYQLPGLAIGGVVADLRYDDRAVQLHRQMALGCHLLWRIANAEVHADVASCGGTAASAGIRVGSPTTRVTIDASWISSSWRWPLGGYDGSAIDRWGVDLRAGVDAGDRAHIDAELSIERVAATLPFVALRFGGRIAHRLWRRVEVTAWGRQTVDRDDRLVDDVVNGNTRRFAERWRTRVGASTTATLADERLSLSLAAERAVAAASDMRPETSGARLDVSVRYRLGQWLSLYGRVVGFQGDRGSELWAAIGELPGRVALKSASGSGEHVAIGGTVGVGEAIDISASYTATRYDDRERISEGSLAEIDGPMEERLWLQIEIGL